MELNYYKPRGKIKLSVVLLYHEIWPVPLLKYDF